MGNGGGSSAGKIDFPDHMKAIHQDWLTQTGSDTVESSMVDAMNACLDGSPYASMTAYDPATRLTSMDTAIASFNTRVDALNPDGDWEDAVDVAVAKADADVFDDTYITADVAAFRANLDERIQDEVLPRFQAGLRDVNAVMSSAFVMGEALIEASANREVAKYETDMRVKFHIQRNEFILKAIEAILRDQMAQVEMEKNVAHYTIEANRLGVVSLKEKKDTENTILVKNGRWDIETFQYGANLLAAIGGGVVTPTSPNGPSTAQSAIGGALSGASIGGAIGGGGGALIGAGLGALLGGFS